MRDQRRVVAAAPEQLVVRAALDDLAVVEHDDLVGVADRREAVRDRDRRAPVGELVERLLDLVLGRVSSELVASSSTSTGGLRRIVRAIAMRCFSPPEKR